MFAQAYIQSGPEFFPIEQIYTKMAAARYSSDVLQSNNCWLTEAIQGLPPELREIIYKSYFDIKLKEQVAFGLKKVHNELLKQPFCHNRQQLLRIIICFNYDDNCRWEGLCYPCYKQGIKHKPLYTPKIEFLSLLKKCSDTYDWHDSYNEIKNLERKYARKTHTHKKFN